MSAVQYKSWLELLDELLFQQLSFIKQFKLFVMEKDFIDPQDLLHLLSHNLKIS